MVQERADACCIVGLSISRGVACLYAQESRDDEVIKQQCAQKWRDDFQMQAHCIEQQRKGLENPLRKAVAR